jgi:hypothetical protein
MRRRQEEEEVEEERGGYSEVHHCRYLKRLLLIP